MHLCSQSPLQTLQVPQQASAELQLCAQVLPSVAVPEIAPEQAHADCTWDGDGIPFPLDVKRCRPPRGASGFVLVHACCSPRFGVHVTGIAFVVYALIGFFGAADFGSNTQGNVLENDLGGGAGQGVLNIAMSLYLALSLPPVEFPTRKTLDYWLPVALLRWPWLRHVMETGTMLCISLLLALLFRSSSAKVLLVTGATGVMMASYGVPVVNHLLLYFGKCAGTNEGAARSKGAVSPLNPAALNPPQRHCDPHHYRISTSWTAREFLKEILPYWCWLWARSAPLPPSAPLATTEIYNTEE
ncbi:hypothetical protein WJX77_006100 [Trebouxia sp. C0004]